ncbi:MAG TPA: energy transducer TonB [Sphingomicrobium sp.]|nr:energy transducer TonB [Sphingomicrobium sp.]
MYRSDLNSRDKSGAIIAVAAVHGALLFALLHLSGRIDLAEPQSVMNVFDITEQPPPPEEVQQPQPKPEEKPKPKEAEGAASEKNIRSRATPVAAPKPEIELPVPVPVTTSETPNQGTEPTQGASTVVGPGTGAGGIGTGTGSGGAGSGTGGGGGGGYVIPPRLLTPVLRGRDFPRPLLNAWPRGAQLFARVRVSPAGTVIQCIVDRGTGVPSIDSAVCNLVEQRFRYSPARNRAGQPVAGWAGYRQEPPH